MTHHYFTNIDDLYNDEGDNNSYGSYKVPVTPLSTLFATSESKSVMRPPCEIRCTDILSHITMCPVCSKLYKEVEKNHGEHHHPALKEHFFTAPSAVNIWKTSVILLGAILLIILILWLKSKFTGSAKVTASFSPYMNRR